MSFTLLLPITRNDYVKAKILFLMIPGLLNHMIYQQPDYAIDLNFAFFGLVFFIYGLFNLIFFSLYFKTGYNYGVPVVVSNVVVLILAIGFEFINMRFAVINTILEGSSFTSKAWQLAILGIGISLYVLFNYRVYRISIRKFAHVDL